ncbi:LysR family transcriptional regulator [Paracoccus sp. R12_1]|uniref:LysR family transcriptional regulator n=1 Tax=unclassified Paracoccus (in: a-proteobacteria) TaxID=2688777 RepID=UPI001ADCBFA9|nr:MULTISPECIES: LysR family transcriptional regulator [unclassified Paracoccus (in: a-proteobacteria)]MBO9455295.1 LysR family transcriptional regulator [Paracoccus sp. R12_2]MBO9488186.1 LysR family transcriptional regulator [Paracoccus sp. R12_1]
MERRGLVWDDVSVFLAVARSGSLSGAALGLSVGLATVSRRVERLEARLGRPLFLRHHTGYQLTEEGAALIERAEEMEAAARAFESGWPEKPEVSGTVRLATAENLATALILPALPRLRRAHPRLTLEIATDIAAVNLHRRDADIALRMIKPERGHVSVQRVGTLGYGLYGAQSYMEGRAGGSELDLERDELIAWAEGYGHLPAAQWIERALRGRAPAVVTTSLATQVAGCASGLGLAVLPHFLAQPRGLICLDADLGIDQPIWLVTQTDLASSRRVQAVASFLREVVSERRVALSVARSSWTDV